MADRKRVFCSIEQAVHNKSGGGALAHMAQKNLKIGDTVKVIGYRAGKYAPGVKDELGTEELFKSLVGHSYKIKGFDDYGRIELAPKRLHTVWIDPDLVELVENSSHAEKSL